jgi:hypothetical protein
MRLFGDLRFQIQKPITEFLMSSSRVNNEWSCSKNDNYMHQNKHQKYIYYPLKLQFTFSFFVKETDGKTIHDRQMRINYTYSGLFLAENKSSNVLFAAIS